MTAFSTAPNPASTLTTPPRRYRPLVPMVISLALAILVAEWSLHHPLWGVGVITSLATAGVGLACRPAGARRRWLALACVLVLGYGSMLWRTSALAANHVAHYVGSTPVALEGQVRKVTKVGPDKTMLDLSARALIDDNTVAPISGRVRIAAYDFEPPVASGDVVRIHRLRLRRPSGFRNPGAFDYERYLARRGIYAIGNIGQAERLEVMRRAPSGHLARLTRVKERLAAHINRTMPESAAAITQEMVLGLRGGLPSTVREAFAASGTAHLMSVSGLHVGFVYAAVFFVLKPCLVRLRFRLLGRFGGGPRPSKLAAAGALLAVLAYACLVGANLPTIRATLMITTYVVAYLLDRDRDPWQTTALAALLILALHPQSLFDLGFQLSFAGVLAILYAQSLLHPPDAVEAFDELPVSLASRVTSKLREAVLIAVFASLGTAPLILYAFQRLPLIAPLANVVVVPLASVAVPLALVASCAALIIQPLGDMLLYLAGTIVTWMYALIVFFAAIPYAAPRVGAVSLPIVVLAYASVLLPFYGQRYRPARWGAVASATAVGVWLSWPWVLSDGRNQLQVTFLDVGHGDASFIRFPQGTTMLIDGGGSYRDDVDIGERVVAPFLWYQRVRQLDYVVATHSHPDHAKGLGTILRDFRVRQFWDNGAQQPPAWYSTLRQTAIEQRIYRDLGVTGLEAHTIDDVRLELLHPSAAFQPPPERRRRVGEDRGENNRSLVLKLTYGAVSVLFTGDIEQEAERFLLESSRDLRATIVKVPHHGSRTSSTEPFVRAVNPWVAVFSVQRDSRFGHPHPAVVERYRKLDALVFRTDRHGAVTVRTDGHSVWVEPHIGEPVVLPAPMTRHLAEMITPPPAAGPQ
jgi:competence protein ComEC